MLEVLRGCRATLFLVVLASLSACAAPVPAPKADVAVVAPKAKQRLEVRGSTLDRLLEQADAAYNRGRYTLPAENNAYDIYRAVLMIEPANTQAQAGLDAVLLAYVNNARRVMASGQLDAAQELANRGAEYFPSALLLTELGDEIRQARAAISATRAEAAHAEVLDGEKILLPELELDEHSEEVVERLAAIAQRLRDSDESVMIYARNDRQGRWIYQTLQQAATDYRIRGDIRISRVPAIVIMQPL